MREIVVISGKGGAGKTSVTAALAHIASEATCEARPLTLCDLDVDAPDLHILLAPEVRERHPFISGHEAVIDPARCTACGACAALCRFHAIKAQQDGASSEHGADVRYVVDPLMCEGCKVCVTCCPAQAIDFPDRHCGEWMLSETRFGPLVHAQLHPGEENSGRLVALLKQQARTLAEERRAGLILSDGSPGVGCPVISSLAGATMAVAVTEPTPSGLHDLTRVAELTAHFRIPTAVIINKHDLNDAQTTAVERLCAERGLRIVGRLPHDPLVTRALTHRRAVTETAVLPELSASPAAAALRAVWPLLMETLDTLDTLDRRDALNTLDTCDTSGTAPPAGGGASSSMQSIQLKRQE